MATCPHCMGALTETHRCPPRGRFKRVVGPVLTILVGGAIGTGLSYGIEEQPHALLVLATAALGAVLASAVRQTLGPRV